MNDIIKKKMDIAKRANTVADNIKHWEREKVRLESVINDTESTPIVLRGKHSGFECTISGEVREGIVAILIREIDNNIERNALQLDDLIKILK